MGELKKSGPPALFRAGESALFIAEELALQKIFRHSRYIDGHKGRLTSGGCMVKGMGHQLLSGTRLPHQEHRKLRGGHLL